MGARCRRLSAACASSMLLPGAALAAAAEDIRGIRGPKTLPGPWADPEVLAAVAVAVFCIAYVIWRWLQRPRRPVSLSESALARLEQTRSLMNPRTAQAFGVSASDAIRDYIEKRFEVVATRQTTEEFLHALLQGSNEVLARHRASLAQFLQQCDFVKFTGGSLAVNDMESLLRAARTFVLETDGVPNSVPDGAPVT